MGVAAALFIPLVADWVAPGAGTRLSCLVLRASCGGMGADCHLPTASCFSLWGWLVGRVGRDVVGLGAISMLGAVVCVGLVAMMAGDVFALAVRGAKADGVRDEEGSYRFVESAAVLLAGLAFALTPGFLRAATRMGPLTVALAPGLAAAGLAVGAVAPRGGGVGTPFERLRKSGGRLLPAAGLAGYSALELALARRAVWGLAFPAVWVWLAVGVLPALVIAWCVRKRRLLGRKGIWWSFGAWAAAVTVMGMTNFISGTLDEGRVASRMAARIIAHAEESGKAAVVSDGALDELYFFMLPEKIKLLSLAREHSPAYGRELSDWVVKRGGAEARRTEDLAFAAELGAGALIDEWAKIDRRGFEAAVATPANCFPTEEKWREACGIVTDARDDEPLGPYLRRLMGVCGNELGCRLLERGETNAAWTVFWEVAEKVDRGNYAALVNLSGMLERGCAASADARERIARWRGDVEAKAKTPERIAQAARAGGRLYVDPEVRERHEAARRAAVERKEPSPRARRFIERLAALAEGTGERGAWNRNRIEEARGEIRKGIAEGMVRADLIGGQLLTLDRALGDWECAESDAIEILRIDRRHAAANAAMGTVNARRMDWAAAERHLRRAGDDANALNDLAYVLARTSRAAEAVGFARRAVGAQPENWNFRETLGDVLVRAGETEAGKAELAVAEGLKAKAEGRGK